MFDIQIFLKVLNNCNSIVIEYYSTTHSIRNFENIQNTMLVKQLYGSWDFKIKMYLVGEMVKLCSICFLYLFHTSNHICKYICPSVLEHMTEFTSTVRLDSNIFFPLEFLIVREIWYLHNVPKNIFQHFLINYVDIVIMTILMVWLK